MKKLFITAAMLLGFSGLMFAQTTPAKSNAKPAKAKTETAKPVKADTTKSATHLKKDGTPDKRYKENTHLKKDGTPDKRYKENKKS